MSSSRVCSLKLKLKTKLLFGFLNVLGTLVIIIIFHVPFKTFSEISVLWYFANSQPQANALVQEQEVCKLANASSETLLLILQRNTNTRDWFMLL